MRCENQIKTKSELYEKGRVILMKRDYNFNRGKAGTYSVMPFNTQRACGLPIESILSKVLWRNDGEEYRQRNAGCVSSRSG